MKVIIPFPLPSLNDYIDACRSGKYQGSSFKSKHQKAIAAALKKQIRKPLREPVVMHYTWVEKNRMRDKDNIAFAKKFVQDALVQIKALRNDGWSNVEGFTDVFAVDKRWPHVEIEITEVRE